MQLDSAPTLHIHNEQGERGAGNQFWCDFWISADLGMPFLLMSLFLILHLEKMENLTVDNLECVCEIQSPQEDDRHTYWISHAIDC